ncbi:MAG: hypothetical protein A2430_00615 [Candidatus Liptonbacteria bacterium RIFOXYC1_FULL_36_8]|uniref:Uncharacterized protein n=3 Tax=Candidatus Liptoniibacteriota TaxID=1817909 RepID=A0A1G2CMT5_9BACT|nr:MAG: hypothetical protein A2390_01875 [Candidatus Liptonbacteria bacterium RIFOXYB1_FULL_36_10]OGZ02954.1 MAG: hypothetical protein A2430_00615 [Candidatus Liptonbacteria bacterium RIFOXYC1_FULL_36_8]OGZ03561.1 MAG: hypothetical protein A2604_00165 [Candidatus Liptonbacteria bacterium RIFOXYD1_FULL_36_11]
MLKKRHKLPIYLFLSLKSALKVIKGAFLTVKIKENNLLISRFGVVISSRFDKRAVHRNYLKRKFFDFFRLNLNKLEKGFDLLIYLSPSVKSDFSEEKILEELSSLLKKSGFLKINN